MKRLTLIKKIIDLYNADSVKEALELCEQLINKRPKHVDGYYLKGKILLSLGEYDEAMKYLDKVLELQVDNDTCLHSKAKCLCALEKEDKKTLDFLKAVKRSLPEDFRMYCEHGVLLAEEKRIKCLINKP